MKKIYLLVIVLALCLTQTKTSHSQSLQAMFDHNTFYTPTEGSYIETYLKVYGNTVSFQINENGNFQAKVDIDIRFKKNGQIIDFRKYTLLSPEVSDTTGSKPDFLDQQRISIPNGIYNIELVISDSYSSKPPDTYTDIIKIDYDGRRTDFSSIQLIEKYKRSVQNSILTKSGFDLIPKVPNTFYPNDVNALFFYTELYNIDKTIQPNSDFLITYFIEADETGKKLADYARNQRQKASIVNVVLGEFDINKLPSGNYNLVVEARDRENKLLKAQKAYFQRSNPGVEINLDDVPTIDISESFTSAITSVDTMTYFVACLRPIADNREKRFIDNQLKARDITLMQQFFLSFWKQHNEKFPEAEWKAYYKQVKYVEEAFSTKIKNGFETDRGRVYLQYGTPNTIEGVRHEPQAFPYEIWHYYTLGENQNDRRFLFYNPNLVGTEYELLHSNARGELNNPNWQGTLYGRTRDTTASYGSRARELFIK